MYILDSTQYMSILLGGPPASSELNVVTSWVDITSSTFVPASFATLTNGVTPVTIVASPGGGTQRQVKLVSVQNTDVSSAEVTITFFDGAGTYRVLKVTLLTGETLLYTDGQGWKVLDVSGAIKGVGPTGSTGATGSQGPIGPPVYLVGDQGEDGWDAIPGNQGTTGFTGAQGPTGPALITMGEDGDDGPPGAPGPAGSNGATGVAGFMKMPVTMGPAHVLSVAALIASGTNNNGANYSTGAAWPNANEAVFIPFQVTEAITVKKMASFNGGTVSGNIDVGIYDASGTKVVSIGSTAQSGTSAAQIFDIADTALAVGNYYFAIALDNTTGTVGCWTTTPSSQICRSGGIYLATTAFPLPAGPVTFAVTTRNFIPNVFWSTTTLI